MKLTYFLRGLGVGIIFAAIISAVALGGSKNSELTDEQIISKAKQLGLVEPSTTDADIDALLDSSKDASASDKADDTKESAKEEATTEEATEAPTTEETTTEEATTEEVTTEAPTTEEATTEEATTEEKADEGDSSEKVTFTVTSGMFSETVASSLQSLGVVDSASKFNKYLCDNGYANRIKTGTHEFTKGESYDSVAQKLIK